MTHSEADGALCPGFAWIGQSFAHCDRCGDPYWKHALIETVDHDKGPFSGEYVYEQITWAQADRVRANWDLSRRLQPNPSLGWLR